jgi:hypothetical protein
VAEQRAHLEELHAGFVAELPGYGVDLIPFEYPYQILWIPPEGSPQVLRYDSEGFDDPESFTRYVIKLFAHD